MSAQMVCFVERIEEGERESEKKTSRGPGRERQEERDRKRETGRESQEEKRKIEK